jgi:hypothetical protein
MRRDADAMNVARTAKTAERVRRLILRTPTGGTVKIIERGNGTAAVFLHSGVGSAGE